MKLIAHLIIFLIPVYSFGQLTLGGSNPQDFVSNTLSGSGVSISNVQYTGSPGAIAYFQANSVNNLPFQSGFVITTGAKEMVPGPNNQPNGSVNNNYQGTSFMNGILFGANYDAAVISFDVVPSGDTLRINYIFGSEEYPEYVGSQFIDGFAILISGPGISGTRNIALLPNGTSITVNNVNNGNPGESGMNPSSAVNPEYFAGNGNGNQAPYNSSNTYLQYDGLTVPLTAKYAVTPNQSYHIDIVIADGGDGLYDSGAFIEEGGVTASLGENGLDQFVTVFYNAINQQATIELKEQQENLSYSIVDLSGKMMTQAKITETTSIDLSDYSSGMYLIRVEGSNGQITKKVIR